MTPEAKTRQQIDDKLAQAGWQVHDMAALNLERSLKQSTAHRQNIFRAAFAGTLVPQDSGHEPASVLLERTRAERAQIRSSSAAGRRMAKTHRAFS